ncbi:MAG: hypothetical protein OXG16_06100 [Rhodospirillales bacterium]|nr:hypothetical protein [Rhodospirillales bacterium]
MTTAATAGQQPVLTVVIGANGAGKTTRARAVRGRLPKPFHNVASIADGLGDPDSAALQFQARDH